MCDESCVPHGVPSLFLLALQAKLAMMERKLNELLQEEKEAEPDDIEKFMM